MIEEHGDIWKLKSDIVCVTTNGVIDANCDAVMGAGIALQAKRRYPDIPKRLGKLLQKHGNHVHYLEHKLVSFPTKFHWKQNSNLNLIEQSAKELVKLMNNSNFSLCTRILLPRPGCSNGNLKWKDVKPILKRHLDSRFIVVNI